MATTKVVRKTVRKPMRRVPASRTRRGTIDRLAPDDGGLREFISDFSAASALMRQLRHRLAETIGLSAAGHSVMLGLWHCERRGSTSVRSLADHLHVAAAHVTAELGKLARTGLVIKRPSARDRRAVNVELTDKGHALLDRLAPLLREVNTSLFANIRYGEMLTVQRFFRLLIGQAPQAIQIADLHAVREARPARSAKIRPRKAD